MPAVANIIAEYGIAVNQMDIKGEFITPTGAAVAAAVRTTDRLPDKYIIKKSVSVRGNVHTKDQAF